VKHWSLITCAISASLIGAGPTTEPAHITSQEIGKGVLILGELGLPVGKETTITGFKKSVGPLQDMFTVETIDGKNVPDRLRIEVKGADKWADGTKATLLGHEVGTLRFASLSDGNLGPDDERWKGPYQTLYLRFVVTEVVSPQGLQVSHDR